MFKSILVVKKAFNYLKYYLLKNKAIPYLLIITGLILAFNLVIYKDFQVNHYEYYEKKNSRDCYIEQYKVFKLVQIFRNSFILFTLLLCVYWFKLVKFSWTFEYEPIPLKKSILNVLIPFFFLAFHLLLGFGAISLFYFELNNLIFVDGWKYIPISLGKIIRSLINDVISFSILNAIVLYVMFSITKYRGLIGSLVIVGYFIILKHVLPGYSLLIFFNHLCPPK